MPRLPASPGAIDLGRPVTLDAAVEQLGFRPLVPHDPRLGAPDGGVPARPSPPEAADPGPTEPSPELFLTQARSNLGPDLIGKFMGPDTGTRRVRVDGGGPGFWIDGPAASFAYRDGAPPGSASRSCNYARSTLLWTSARLLLRLSRTYPATGAEIARSVR